MSWVTGAAPKLHAGSNKGNTAIELQNEVVTWSVLVWFARLRGMKNWVCGGLVVFLRRRGCVLEADGPRAAVAPVALSLKNGGSHCVAYFGFSNTPRRIARTPLIE